MSRNVTIVVIILILVVLAGYLVWIRSRFTSVNPEPAGQREIPALVPTVTLAPSASPSATPSATPKAGLKVATPSAQ